MFVPHGPAPGLTENAKTKPDSDPSLASGRRSPPRYPRTAERYDVAEKTIDTLADQASDAPANHVIEGRTRSGLDWGAGMAKRVGRSIALATVSMLALTATGAWAQDASAGGAGASASQAQSDTSQKAQVDEVIVTAQRRSERLQSVPIAVSSVSGVKLTEDGVTDILMIKVEVPGANVRDIAGYSLPYIRGVGSSAKTPLDEPPVATYVDEVYYGTQVNFLSFNNIDKIEVIKGPQGTLFGRNDTGGLFNVTTANPSFRPTGALHLGYGDYDTVSGDGYFSAGITDKLAADVSVVGSTQGDGFGKNLFNGEDILKNDHNVAVRSKLLYTPDSDTRAVFIVDYDDEKSSIGVAGTPQPGTHIFGGGTYPVISSNPYDVDNNVQGGFVSRAGGLSLNMSHDFNSLFQLKSITAYRLTDYDLISDQDATKAPATSVFESTHYTQFTQELQAQSLGHGPFSWTTGVFYYHALAHDHTFLDAGVFDIAYHEKFHTDSIAGYAQGTYAITSDTNLTAGGRYTHESRDVTGSVVDDLPGQVPGALLKTVFPTGSKSLSVEKPSYRVSLDHKFTNDLMVYASYNSSFKSGGFSYVNIKPFLPEELTAYEVGAKSDLFGRRATFNVSTFYYDYRDIQVQAITPTGNQVLNGAGAHLYGLDADLHARITSKLSFTSGIEFLHAAYSAFNNVSIGTPLGGQGIMVGSASGNALPFAPHVTANVGVLYKIPFASGILTSSILSYYSSKYYAQPDNAEFQNGYGSANGSITWDGPSGVSVRVWANNLADKVVVANATDSGPTGNHQVIYEPPRTFGASVGYHF